MRTAYRKKLHFKNKNEIPASYPELCKLWMPRPIHDKKGCEEATSIVDALAGFDLSTDQEDYLEAVAIFLEEYEGANSNKISGLELLRYLCEENGLTGADLSLTLGATRNLGSAILRGERQITAKHAKALAKRFKLNAGAFL